jgi:hypothetical protein
VIAVVVGTVTVDVVVVTPPKRVCVTQEVIVEVTVAGIVVVEVVVVIVTVEVTWNGVTAPCNTRL